MKGVEVFFIHYDWKAVDNDEIAVYKYMFIFAL